jgi:hypothetical protein
MIHGRLTTFILVLLIVRLLLLTVVVINAEAINRYSCGKPVRG